MMNVRVVLACCLLGALALSGAFASTLGRNKALSRAAVLRMRCGQSSPPQVCRCGQPRMNTGCYGNNNNAAASASTTSTPSRQSFEAAQLLDDSASQLQAAPPSMPVKVEQLQHPEPVRSTTPTTAASTTAAPAKVKKQSSKVKPVYLYDNDDDSGSPHVTVIHNANELNDGFNKHGMFGGHGGNGDGNGNGGGGGGGGQPPGDPSCGRGGKGTCSAFWKGEGCPRPRVPNARAKCTHCSASFNCDELCCENPPIYGNCANFWQNKGCPTKTHFPLKQNAAVSCGVEAVCFGRCCKHKPFACEHFWEKSDCPRQTHVRKQGVAESECDPESVHCLEQCCEPQEIACETFFTVNGGCPAGYRINHDRMTMRCRDSFTHGEACWKRCCDSVPLGDGRCSYWGDPHVVSFDNRAYNCFTPGEYVMMDNPDKQESVHNVQLKHPDPNLQHVPPLNTGMAFRAKDDVIAVELVAPAWATFQVNLRYNGKLMPYPKFKVKYGPFIVTPIGVLPEPNAPWTAFAHDPMISIKNTLSGTGVIVHYQNVAWGMRHFNIEVAFPNRAQKGQLHTTGLCGTWNGNPGDDFCGRAEDDCCKSFLVPRAQTIFPVAPAQGGPADTKATPETVCKTSSRLHDAHNACRAVTGLKEDCVMEFCSGEGKVDPKQLAHEIKEVITGK